MERLSELTKDYDPVDIWNMDKTGSFFKALLEKGLVEKKSQATGGKKSKTRLTIYQIFFIESFMLLSQTQIRLLFRKCFSLKFPPSKTQPCTNLIQFEHLLPPQIPLCG